MVIMAQAKKTRKQWRPKAIIESAAAQHRTNADQLITAYYQEKQSTINISSIPPDKTSITSPMDINETSPKNRLEHQRNSLMLKLSTPVLSPGLPSGNLTSSSNEQNDDEEERDDSVLYVEHEQTNGNNQIEVLPSDDIHFKTKNCSSQTDNDRHSRHTAKRIKTRLKKSKTNSASTAITAAVNLSANNVKVAKRKAYSRMKKERKATQTLIIVLSKLIFIYKCPFSRNF